MNVCLLSDAIQPPLTGIGRYAFELASLLNTHPDITRLELLSYRGSERSADMQARCAAAEDAGSRSGERAWQAFLSRSRAWLIDRKAVSGAYEFVQNWQYQRALAHRTNWVIHGPNYHLPNGYPRGNASVVTVHDLSTELFPQWHPDQRVERMKHVLRSAITRADLILVDAASTASDLIERFQIPSTKIVAIPLGVDAIFSELPLSLPRRHTLCVSTVEPRKNIGALLSAYQALPAAVKQEYPLLLVGGYGWKSEATHHQIEECASQGWLKYLGYVPQTELLRLYACARLVVYPSLHEGFGLPVLEAMAAGCRVVAGNHSSIPEVAGGLAHLVNVRHSAELTHAIEQALEQNWNAAEASARRVHASQFTWRSTVEKTTEAYRTAQEHVRN